MTRKNTLLYNNEENTDKSNNSTNNMTTPTTIEYSLHERAMDKADYLHSHGYYTHLTITELQEKILNLLKKSE